MSDSQGEAQMQTFGEAKTSFIDVVQSSFASLAQMLGISQLKESFYQNIIYILIVIVIMIGILVYVQMVGIESKGPLFSPPTKEIKKVEIRRRIVEGFDANVDFGNKDIGNPANINESGGDDNGDDNSHNPSLDEGLSEHYENKKRR
jgi:hypothetical protein